MTALFLCIGTMSAQAGRLAKGAIMNAEQMNALTEATDIVIQNISGTNRWYFCGDKNVEDFSANSEALFVWEPAGDGKFYLKKKYPTEAQGDGYLQTSSPANIGSKEGAQKFTAAYVYPTDAPDASADSENLVRFVRADNTGSWINCQGTNATPVYNSGAGAWTMHNVYQLIEGIEVTYIYKVDGKEYETAKVMQAKNSGASAPEKAFLTIENYEGTIGESDCEIVVNCSVELPFVPGAWYYVRMHNNPSKYIEENADGTVDWVKGTLDENPAETFVWAFVGDIWTGFNLVNKGTGHAVTSTSGSATMGDAANATAFVLSASKVKGGFCMKYPESNYLNANGGKVNSWDDNDGGSTFFLEALPEDEPVDPNDYTSAIANADLSVDVAKDVAAEGNWNTVGTKGISDGMVKVASESAFDFNQTITLPAGQYKMTAKAVYRYAGNEADEFAAIEAGTETHLVKLYAETATYKYEADVKNRWEGASETDYANGSGSVTVDGKFVPNSSAAVQAWFDADQYVNELVFNVQTEGTIKVGITRISGIAGDYTNIGAWTLTRLGDAEADPKQEEPSEEDYDLTEGTWADATSYIVNADLASKDGWSASGLENDSKFDVSLRAVEFYSGWDALLRTEGFLRQEVTLPAGIYRLTGKAFFRQGNGAQDNPEKSLGYLVAGDNKVVVKTLGSANGTANDFGAGANALYADDTFNSTLEFTLEEEAILNIGYEVAFDEMKSWFIVGNMTLEKKITLKDNFMEQVMAFNELVQGQDLAMISGVQAKLAAALEPIAALYTSVEAGDKVLKADVVEAMETMTALTAEANAVIKYYKEAFLPAKALAYDTQDNSTANTSEVASAYEAVVSRTYNLGGIATLADLETLVADLEAARQAYVVNAVPTNDFTFDMTFKIADAAVTSKDAWTNGSTASGQQYAGAPDNTYLDWCNWSGRAETVDMYQVLTDMPSGVYTLKAATRAEAKMTGVIYADTCETEIHHVGNSGNELEGGWGWTVVEKIIVVNGKLTIGFKTTAPENGVWAGADNFSLAYVSALPESVFLELKKESFKERAAEFAAYPVDNSWTMINNNYYWMVADAVLGNADYEIVGVLDTLDKVTSVEVLDKWMAEMDKSEAVMDEAYALAAEYNYYKNLFFAASENSTPANDEVGAAAGMALESTMGIGYMAGTVSDLESATAALKDAYLAYVTNAIATDGYLFDVSFLLTNATCDSMDGWTAEGTVGTNRGQHWSDQGDNTYIEPCEWGATSWNASISQTISLPNGMYTVRVAGRASAGVTLKLVANGVEEVIPAVGDAGGTIATDGTEWADVATGITAGKSFANGNAGRGWSYVSADSAKVENGELTISVVGTSSTQYQWSSVDDFSLYCVGVEKPANVEVTEITLNHTWGELNEVGATLQLVATVNPEDATDKTITWSSSNPEIATVDENGLVTVVAAAMDNVEITATAANGVFNTCYLTVYVIEPGTVTGVSLNTTWKDLVVEQGETFQLVATVEPEDATDKTVTWSSNAPEIATVDATGLVTFVGAVGTTEEPVQITVTTSNGITATCYLTVTINLPQGIDTINADSNAVIYDIHGRRVTKMEKGGIYIVNGKKVIKK